MRASSIAPIPLLAVLATARYTDGQRPLVVTRTPPHAVEACLAESYYGAYGGRQEDHIYIPSVSCLSQSVASGSIGEDVAGFGNSGGRLLWVGHAGVQDKEDEDMMAAWETVSSLAGEDVETQVLVGDQGSQQKPFGGSKAAVAGLTRVHVSRRSMVIHAPDHLLPIIDTFLPPYLVPVALPTRPVPFASGQDTGSVWSKVPSEFVARIANLTSNLKFDSRLDVLVSGIELGDVRRTARWLTGEAPSGITSRHSFTPGALKAAEWLAEQVEETGAACHLEPFLDRFAPNVICEYPSVSNSSELVILSGHYDSRGSFGSTVAPGGDDDGSGTSHVVAVAHAIKRGNVNFDKKVILAFFAGEEQGLLGSHAFAERLHGENATVLLHVQADMLAYHEPGEPLQLGLPESIGLPEAAWLVGNISQIYAPELLVGRTAACCSDHQSFVAFGFPATQVFERNGPIADPMYHNSGDVTQREGYDFDQVVSIAKVTFGTVLTVAGWSTAD